MIALVPAPLANVLPGFPERCTRCGSPTGLDVPTGGGPARWYCGVGHSGTVAPVPMVPSPNGRVRIGASPRRGHCMDCDRAIGAYKKRCRECKKAQRRQRER